MSSFEHTNDPQMTGQLLRSGRVGNFQYRVENEPDLRRFHIYDMQRPLGGGSYKNMFRNILRAEIQTDAGAEGNAHQVLYLGGAEEGRPHLMTMLGLIHRSAIRENKTLTVDPSDVSKHSLKLVNNLVSRGLIPESSNPTTKKLNKMSFVGDEWEYPLHVGSRIPTVEVEAARQHAFNLLRSNPRKR